MRWILIVLGLAAPVAAEPLDNIDDLIAQIEGQEVNVEGRLGQRLDSEGILVTQDSQYRVRYALTRDQLDSIENCEINGSSRGCPVSMSAEIRVQEGRITLLAFDIKHLQD